MDHRSIFKECKKRNEQQLLDIRKLESRISHIKQQIETKKKAKTNLKQKEIQYNQAIRHHKLLQKLLTKEIPGLSNTTYVETRAGSTGKHDLTQLLATTPDLVCKKIEILIQQRLDSDESLNAQHFQHIHHLIARLPTNQVNEFVSSFSEQLKHELHTIPVPEEQYEFQQNIEDQQEAIEHISSQKQRAKELTKRKDQLELETREAEIRLVRRVRELYADPAVQSALVKNIRVKAANHQVNVELQSTIQGANDINKRSHTIQDISNAQVIANQVEKLKKDIARKQDQVQCLINVNNEFSDAWERQTIEAKDMRENEYQLLIDRIRQTMSNVTQLLESDKNIKSDVEEADKNDALLMDIKNSISPHSLISDTRAIAEIVNLVNSTNELSKDSVVDICSDIRSTLESLVEKWGSSLEKQNIPVTEEIPENHDGIDNVIQTVDALREFIMKDEQVYVSEQEEKLKEKLALADKVDHEIKRVQDTLEERELIKHIGVDYTIQDKSFNEWLQKLLVKDE